jgi:hypothetical protein
MRPKQYFHTHPPSTPDDTPRPPPTFVSPITPMTLFAAAAPLTLPITDPVLIVAVAGAIFLLAPLLVERLRVPGLIGLIVAGAVVGPNGLNLLARDETIVLLGTVGLLYLMFMAGVRRSTCTASALPQPQPGLRRPDLSASRRSPAPRWGCWAFPGPRRS